MRRLLPALLLAAGTAQAAERPGPQRLCPEDFPEGVHLAPQPGCDARQPHRQVGDDGFRDLGNGVSVRVSGRAVAEFGARR